MTAPAVSISAEADAAVLEAGRLRVEVSMRPFSFTIRRNGRSLLRADAQVTWNPPRLSSRCR